MNLFLSDDPSLDPAYNDLDVEYDEDTLQYLLQNGVDEILARHVAHQFVRDPLVIYRETLDQDNEASTDHYENLSSTNWNSMRLKLPPPQVTVLMGLVGGYWGNGCVLF